MAKTLPPRDIMRDELNKMLDAQGGRVSGSEQGKSLNVYEFLCAAMADIQAGDYAGFLCNMDLAGQFARDARTDYYARTVK